MYINRLLIEHLRNLQSLNLDELALVNFFIGDNGAGKTSVLEAIAIASLGRSFRHHKIQPIINQEQSALSVFVQCTDDSDVAHKLGINRDRKNQYQIRINGANASSLAELSYVLPVVAVDSNAFALLDGSAGQRRQFIDWGVFHVEHDFYQHWRQLQRILKQRNSLLRKKASDYSVFEVWDKAFVTHSIAIEKYRLNYLSLFEKELTLALQALDSELCQHKIFYKNGWTHERIEFDAIDTAKVADEEQLMADIRASFDKDVQYQRTHIGPQKADLQIRFNQNDVKDIYSRGQKKTIVAAMKLAQAKVVSRETLRRPILLLDDLPSELDDKHLNSFIQHVVDEKYQCFITAVDEHKFGDIHIENSRLFRVSKGKIVLDNQSTAVAVPND